MTQFGRLTFGRRSATIALEFGGPWQTMTSPLIAEGRLWRRYRPDMRLGVQDRYRRPKRRSRDGQSGRADHGFTLVEVLAALTIVGVATYLFIALFASSLDLAQASRNLKVAADLAEGRLYDLVHHPAGYAWPSLAEVRAGDLAPVRPDAGTDGSTEAMPAAMPLDPASRRRETVFHEKFSQEAFARLPRPDAAYLEVTAVIRWVERGRDQVFMLTSCVPRTVLEGA